jgi:excisionase family DNA binding protein
VKKKGKEISVKKAAKSLKLSERTVLNFIKQKNLEAIKVGRDWFIDYASFVSFALIYDIPISERDRGPSEIKSNFSLCLLGHAKKSNALFWDLKPEKKTNRLI